MKIFDAKFIRGVCIVFLGLFFLMIGAVALLSSTGNIFLEILLVLTGPVLVKAGFIVVEDAPPKGSKIEIETMRKAKIIKNNKK